MKKTIILSSLLMSLLVVAYTKFRQTNTKKHFSTDPMTTFLQQYIQIETTGSLEAYNRAINFLQNQAKQDGFDTQVIDLPQSYKALVVSYHGTNPDLPSLALNHHIDVVPADAASWKFPPFSGHIENGYIYGRGTQDMKSVGVCQYFALQKLKQNRIKPKRSIHLIMVPDEEHGGFKGTKQLFETAAFKKLNIGFVLDEGLPSGSNKELLIRVSERKPMQMEFVCKGTMSHGSLLMANNPTHSLVTFLSKLSDFQKKQQMKTDDIPAGLLLSTNITSLTAGIEKNGIIAMNVVPEFAKATVDMRVPPTMKKAEAQTFIESILSEFPNITYAIKAAAGEYVHTPDNKSLFYTSLEKTINKCGLASKTLFAEFASDMRFYIKHGIQGLGISPFTIKDNLHGVNECIKLSDLQLGKNVFYAFLLDFCR